MIDGLERRAGQVLLGATFMTPPSTPAPGLKNAGLLGGLLLVLARSR